MRFFVNIVMFCFLIYVWGRRKCFIEIYDINLL